MKKVEALTILGLGLACASLAHAGGVVSTCDEAHLRAALNGGGLVTFSCSGTITLTGAPPLITVSSNTTINGRGQNVTISGGLYVVQAGITFHLNRITVAHGYDLNNDQGTVIITNSTFAGNSSGTGGAIYNNNGTLSISNSVFSGNSATLGGGAIFNFGTLTVSKSTFSGNSAGGVNVRGDIYGGAIFNSFGTLTVTNSTFFGNTAATLDNAYGGGIANGGTATIINSTISGNTAVVPNNGQGRGGGVWSLPGMTLVNTIITNNNVSGTTGSGNCYFTGLLVNDGGGNLTFGDTSCPSSFFNADPMLGPLQSNGGVAQTMALGAGSPAIGKAVGANCPSQDERGFPRPIQSPYTLPCSIGAYEPGTLFKSFHVNDDATHFTANSFAVSGTFTLGADSDPNVYPPNDVVQLRFGTFTIVIPAGSFAPTAAGTFVYGGVPPSGVTFQMTIQPLGGSVYGFMASASGQNIMAGTTSPVIAQLTLDDDGGTTRTPADLFGD